MANLAEERPTYDFSPSSNRLELDANNNVVVVTANGSYTIPNSNQIGISLDNDDLHYYTVRSHVGHNGATTSGVIHLTTPVGPGPQPPQDTVSATTVDAAFHATRLFPAPTSVFIDNDVPVETGSLSNVFGMDADAGGFTTSGPVTHIVNSDHNIIVNITLGSGHLLHPGIIIRHTYEDPDGLIYVETLGVGVGPIGTLNSIGAPAVWGGTDQSIKGWLIDQAPDQVTQAPDYQDSSTYDPHLVIPLAMGFDSLSEGQQEAALINLFLNGDVPYHPINTPQVLAELLGSDRASVVQGIIEDGGCFLAGTEISMWDGTKKPIEEIREGDLVTSYDDNGKLVPRPVTRTMTHRVKHILDVHGLMVTPGHVTLCGDGRFNGQHVPMIDILRSDGALVKEDGTKVRAGTNEVVGSPRDQLIHVISGERDADGKFTQRQRGRIRLGTKFIFEDEKGDSYVACIADIIERAGGIVRSDGMIVREPDGEGMPYLWPNGPLLPHPEDYVLQRSKLTLNDIYAAGEWEAVQPQMPPPPSSEALPVKGPEGLIAKPANAVGALPRQAASPGKPMTRQQRRAAQAKERKATKARKRMALT